LQKKNKGVISLLGISGKDDVREIRNAYIEVRKTLEESSQEYQSQFVQTGEKAIQISEYSKDDEADIIILNYRDENSWKSFFLENFFKQIINNTDIPLFFLKNKYTKKESETITNNGYDITLPNPG